MNRPQRIIAVIDLFDPHEQVVRLASHKRRMEGVEVRFVTLFDHLTWRQDDGCEISSTERFRQSEHALLERLQHDLRRCGVQDPDCQVISGSPSSELSLMAKAWGCDLILTDWDTARVLQNGWVPYFQTVTPMPCPIHRVMPDPRRVGQAMMEPLLRFANLLGAGR
ncbi:MAG: universal stress protein [Magnetococcales bacterium]|nr:universal stress protein [Magnetococcales bacterium]